MFTITPNPYTDLPEKWLKLDAEQTGEVIFILDASESAASYQDDIIRFCQETIANLPASLLVQLYFLGNPKPYPAQQLATYASSWFQENASRCSLVTPVLETLSPHDFSTIVILGAGIVYDLYDWIETPYEKRFILVNLGESLQTANELEELQNPSVAALRQRLHDPLSHIQLSGDGFLPIRWNNPGYRRVCDEKGRMILRAERLESYALELQLRLPEGVSLRVERGYASGRQTHRELPTQPLPPTPQSAAGQLTEAEIERFHQARQKRKYTCPHCGKPHSWETLYCQEGISILGQAVYPSLREHRGFVRLCAHLAGGVDYFLHSDILYLGNGIAAIQNHDRAERVRFDPATGGWVTDGDLLSPYHPLGGDCYALLL